MTRAGKAPPGPPGLSVTPGPSRWLLSPRCRARLDPVLQLATYLNDHRHLLLRSVGARPRPAMVGGAHCHRGGVRRPRPRDAGQNGARSSRSVSVDSSMTAGPYLIERGGRWCCSAPCTAATAVLNGSARCRRSRRRNGVVNGPLQFVAVTGQRCLSLDDLAVLERRSRVARPAEVAGATFEDLLVCSLSSRRRQRVGR